MTSVSLLGIYLSWIRDPDESNDDISQHFTGSGCSRPDIKVESFSNYEDTYSVDEITTITCRENYVVPWATTVDNKVGDIKCVDDGSGNLSWSPDPVLDTFNGTIDGCVGWCFSLLAE